MRSLARRRQIVVDAAFALLGLLALGLVGMIAIAELSTSFVGVAICGLLLLPAAAVALRPGAFEFGSLGLTGAIIVGLPPLLVALAITTMIIHPFAARRPPVASHSHSVDAIANSSRTRF